MKLSRIFLAGLVAVAFSACSDDEPSFKGSDDSTNPKSDGETPAEKHVSAEDFEKYVVGHVWGQGQTFDSTSLSVFRNGDGDEFKHSPWTGGGNWRKGFYITDSEYTQFNMTSLGVQEETAPKFHRRTCGYTYDETTGMINCDMRLNSYNVNTHSLYLVSVDEDRIVFREEYGVLPVGYKEHNNEITSYELDPESYIEVTYLRVTEENEQDWWTRFSPLK